MSRPEGSALVKRLVAVVTAAEALASEAFWSGEDRYAEACEQASMAWTDLAQACQEAGL